LFEATELGRGQQVVERRRKGGGFASEKGEREREREREREKRKG